MKIFIKITLLILLVFTLSCATPDQRDQPASHISVEELKTEGLKNPIGIDTSKPRFSWKIQTGEKNVYQEAYQILVASSPDKLNENDADLWNSNKVLSNKNLNIEYSGNTLKSKDQCYWKVKIWTNKGYSYWNEPEQKFEIALLNYKDWWGRWIGFYKPFPWEVVDQYPTMGARYLRQEFNVKKEIKSAKAYISGLGLYELYLNGQKVGDDVLAPSPTDYTQNVKYNVLDVAEYLKSGDKNAIGVMLGNGRYFPMRPVYKPYKIKEFGLPKVLFHMEINYTDGSRDVVYSNDKWKGTADGPIRNNNEYDGEYYDARKEFKGWTETGFDDAEWLDVDYMTEPGGDYQAQMNDNMKVMRELKPISISRQSSDTYILDMGQNFSGWLEMQVNGKRGQQVELRFAESLNEDGSIFTTNLRDARVTDTYILSGNGDEVWEPSFTYHGFRYVEISGYPGTPTVDDFTGKLVFDDMSTIGTFQSSNPLLDQIFENAWWGIASNYKGMPVDCPQRNERQPWLADHAVVAYGESFLFDNTRLYVKWLEDMRESQKADGSMPDVAPAYWNYYSDNMTWPGTMLIIAEMLYQQTGDPKVISDNYPTMKKWLSYMQERYMEDNIMTKDSYGDWCKPPVSIEAGTGKNADKKEPSKLIATAYFYKFMHMMAEFAKVSGNDADITEFQLMAPKVKASFNEKFYNLEGYYGENTMTDQVLPLYFGLTDEQNTQKVFDNLVRITVEEKDSHLSTGLIGTQWLMRTFSDFGRPDLAYQIATNTTYPSWGYMLKNGATTIWELWHGNVAAPKMNSQNHVMMLGDLLVWYYESLAGIKAAVPGYYQIEMKPEFSVDLDFVSASYESVQGLIKSEWKKTENGLIWNISIPPNSSALVYFTASDQDQITEKSGANDFTFLRKEGDRLVYEVKSGDWEFVVK
ncbi:MAG: family 78 glycoside hydrolase catalytic domain [Cyclobacteriaceae bacterium]